MASNESQTKLRTAALLYIFRKGRKINPVGTFIGSTWVIAEEEWRPCCNMVDPTRLFNIHCRSVRHIAQLMEVNEKALQREIQQVIRDRRNQKGKEYQNELEIDTTPIPADTD